jgi:hypothetical protein
MNETGMSRPTGYPPLPEGQIRSSRQGWARVVETWYDDDPASLKGYDVWISHVRSRRLSPWGWHYRYTLLVDLTRSPEALLGAMNKTTAKQVKQAETKDRLQCTILSEPTMADLEAFAEAYDACPVTPEQPPLERDRLRELWQAGFLHLSEARTTDGTVLARHGVLMHGRSGIAQTWYTLSNYHTAADAAQVALVGRANRWLYYREFLHFKELGCHTYDLNGWYTGNDDPKRLKINQFKESFHGRIWFGYDCEEAVSLRGWVYVIFKTVKRWLFLRERSRELRRLRRKPARLPDYTGATES